MNSNNQIKKEELKNTLLSNVGKIVYIKYLNGGREDNAVYTYAVVSGIENDNYLRCVFPTDGNDGFCYSIISLDTIALVATDHSWYRDPEKALLYGGEAGYNLGGTKKK